MIKAVHSVERRALIGARLTSIRTADAGARVINLRAERLSREWAAQFEAGANPDPFAPGGPWAA